MFFLENHTKVKVQESVYIRPDNVQVPWSKRFWILNLYSSRDIMLIKLRMSGPCSTHKKLRYAFGNNLENPELRDSLCDLGVGGMI